MKDDFKEMIPEGYYKKCFFGRVFEEKKYPDNVSGKKRAVLEKTIRKFLEEWNMTFFPDDKKDGKGELLPINIVSHISKTPLGLYDVSADEAENVYGELGYAIALDRPCYILVSKTARGQGKPKSNFQCNRWIKYNDTDDEKDGVFQNLYEQLKQRIDLEYLSPKKRLNILFDRLTYDQKMALAIISNSEERFARLIDKIRLSGIGWGNENLSNLLFLANEFLDIDIRKEGAGDLAHIMIKPAYNNVIKTKLRNYLEE